MLNDSIIQCLSEKCFVHKRSGHPGFWPFPISKRSKFHSNASLVGGLEHFLFFHILGIIIPTDFHIFQRGKPPTRSMTTWEPSCEVNGTILINPWTLLTNRIGRTISFKILLNIYWPGNKFFFCRVSKIGNGFSDVLFCIFQKFQIWCLAIAGEVHFDAIVAAVSRLFGLGPGKMTGKILWSSAVHP